MMTGSAGSPGILLIYPRSWHAMLARIFHISPEVNPVSLYRQRLAERIVPSSMIPAKPMDWHDE
jgi:hypothetical protein